MNHNEKAVNITIELLKKHNIRHIVISPGGTNITFVKSVQNDNFFNCYSIIDERSAVYFAIGLYLQTGEPVAMSCTSAQATRNYIPGLTEAFYKHVPILAITMEKHPRFIGQDYMQAPHQCSLPDDSIKCSYELPFITDINDEYYCIRLVNEAILSLCDGKKGPVQLCIPWLDFEISNVTPPVRRIEKIFIQQIRNIDTNGKKVLIVVGEHRIFENDLRIAIESFCETHNCAIYVNHLSNFHGKYALNANLGFTDMPIDIFVKEYSPDIIISLGGQTGDYPLYLLLSKPEVKAEHWSISEEGKIIDTYDKLTKVFQMSEIEFFSSFNKERNPEHSYYESLLSLCSSCNTDIVIPLSNAYIAQELHSIIPHNSIMQFSILNSLRVWNLFDLDPSIECYSNVGAFGIDGGLSTLVGQSIISDDLAFMIIGDLAFYYDMNAIGIRYIKNNLRIILINNNGGVEFKLNNQNHQDTDKYIAAANHFKTAKGWAESCGFEYIEIKTKEDFAQNKEKLIKQSTSPILMEVFVSDKDDYMGYKRIVDFNRDLSFSYLVKKGISKIINR